MHPLDESKVIALMQAYERRTATKNFAEVAPLIHPQAVYVFTDGRFYGLQEIEAAFNKTWETIKNEVYTLSNYRVTFFNEKLATVTYDFNWEGDVNGERQKGSGRGSNTLMKTSSDSWIIVHEYLSK